MAGTTWSKFFWSDWRSDPGLRACSYAARGLWMDMLGIAAEADPIGYVLLNSKPVTSITLARITGGLPDEVDVLLKELDQNGVYSLDSYGRIYCRRMVRDAQKAGNSVENGKTGGNPALRRGTVPKDQRVRPYRRSDSPQKTRRIFDRTGGACFWCARPMRFEADELSPDFFHVDHLRPVSDGGGNDEDNLVGSCAECNHKRARNDWNNPKDQWTKRPTPTPNINVGRPQWKSPEARLQSTNRPESVASTEHTTHTESVDTIGGVSKKDALLAFNDWWLLVPLKVGKGHALKAYLKALTKTDPKTLTEGIERYAKTRNGGDAQFTAHPATWLNAERWSDEPVSGGNGSGQPAQYGSRTEGVFAGVARLYDDLERQNEGNLSRGRGCENPISGLRTDTIRRARPPALPGLGGGETIIEPDGRTLHRNAGDPHEGDDSEQE